MADRNDVYGWEQEDQVLDLELSQPAVCLVGLSGIQLFPPGVSLWLRRSPALPGPQVGRRRTGSIHVVELV